MAQRSDRAKKIRKSYEVGMLRREKLDAFFKPALDLTSELMEIAQESGTTKSKKCEEARALIEAKLIAPEHSQAEQYLGCLLIAYMHDFIDKNKPPVEADLRNFIRGQHDVKGAGFGYNRYNIWPDYPYLTQNAGIAINRGNRLALWKICEMEMAKEFGDADIAERLAASTMRLGCREDAKNYSSKSTHLFCESIQKHGCNPYQNARILEFAAINTRLDRKARLDGLKADIYHVPLIELFAHYRDYSPNDHTQAHRDGNPITISNPQGFAGAESWPDATKFDYVIASNIFCRGAYSGRVAIFHDLMPHLSQALRDGGKLVVSNTASDGMYVQNKDTKELMDLCIEDIGLKLASPLETIPSYDQNPNATESGIYVLERDYSLRPPLAYTCEENQHDLEARKHPHRPSFQERLDEQRTEEHRRAWETRF